MNSFFKKKNYFNKNQYCTCVIPNVMKPLKKAISLSANKKIKSIVPLEQKFLLEYPDITYKGMKLENQNIVYNGVKLEYNDGSKIYIECSENAIGAIMWYYGFDNNKFTSYINHDTKYYIIKNLE